MGQKFHRPEALALFFATSRSSSWPGAQLQFSLRPSPKRKNSSDIGATLSSMCFFTASNRGCASFDMARLLSSGSRSGRGGAAAFILVWTFIGVSSVFGGETLERIPAKGKPLPLPEEARSAVSKGG
jgi:hypothetical protein